MEDDISDSGLSQFEAEIEENLSSASPDTSARNDTNDHVSDDAMDVDSEDDVKPSHNKGRKGGSTREYFDPELYGLRRSVCLPRLGISVFRCQGVDRANPNRVVRELSRKDLCLKYVHYANSINMPGRHLGGRRR